MYEMGKTAGFVRSGGKRSARADMKQENHDLTDYRVYRFGTGEAFLVLMGGIAALLAISWLFYDTWIAAAILSPLLIFWMKRVRLYRCEKRKEKLNLEFREALNSLSVSVRAGMSVENAVAETEKSLRLVLGENSCMDREFSYLVSQIGVRVPVEKLFLDFGRRSGVEDIENFAAVFATAKRFGGSMTRVIVSTAESIEERIEVRREIETVLASKKMEQRIMALMPCGIILYMRVASAGFLDVLYGSAFGALVMSVCLAMYATAVVWGMKIVDIRV
jgi:tight adherence protein B